MNDSRRPPLEQLISATAPGLPAAEDTTDVAQQAEPEAASGSELTPEEMEETSELADAALLALLGMC